MNVIRRLLLIGIVFVMVFPICALWSAESTENRADLGSRQIPAQKIVKVGGYDFPPYVQEESGKFKGLTLDLLEMMNAFQSEYRFQFVPTSSMRRYKDFKDRVYDAILFESVDWGWNDIPVDVSRVYAHDGEVFVARAQPGRTQAYFDDLKGKSLQVFLGYHYPFAQYNADPEYLLQAFNARTTVSHDANIRSVLAGRADLAVVTRSFLQKHLRDNPASIPRLLVSHKIEHSYRHTILIRKDIKPSVSEINAILEQMEQAGYISILLGKYGIEQTPASAVAQQGQEPVYKESAVQDKSKTIVKVGGYHFPPYVEHISGRFSGLTLDLIELMNAFQSKYRFVFVPATSVTRYKDFDDGSFDIMFFEREEWGWKGRPIASSREFLHDAEVFVTRLAQGRTQQYFDSIAGKSLLGYVGYHYPITDYQTDPALLLQRYNMRVSASHADNMKAVLDRSADIAIITRSFAIRYLRNHPASIPHVLMSRKPVQDYQHTILARESSKPILKDIMDILSALDRAGYSSLLWGKYDLTPISENQ